MVGFRDARAAFVAFHLAAVTLGALPAVGPSGLDRSAWKEATPQREFQAWADRLGGLGLAVSPAALEEWAWGAAVRSEAARTTVLAPFEPYYAGCGTRQAWRMFVAAHRFPARLEIAVDSGSGFEVVYLARSDTRAWRRAWFDDDRTRAATNRFAWPAYRRQRQQFVDWVAEHVARDFAEARRVRVSWLRSRTPSPAETLAGVVPEETREYTNVRRLTPPELR